MNRENDTEGSSDNLFQPNAGVNPGTIQPLAFVPAYSTEYTSRLSRSNVATKILWNSPPLA